ncbi:MAG: DUF3592 domain-containing protein [Novosphingobium sp.]
MVAFLPLVAAAVLGIALWALWQDQPLFYRDAVKVIARVTGHRQVRRKGGGEATTRSQFFAPVYEFESEAGPQTIVDPVSSPGEPRPPIGTMIELSYPPGRPDLARPRRGCWWYVMYAFLGSAFITCLALAASLALG